MTAVAEKPGGQEVGIGLEASGYFQEFVHFIMVSDA